MTSRDFLAIFRELTSLVVEESSRLPGWSRPFVVVALMVLFSLSFLFVGPFLLLSRRRRRREHAVREIERHLGRLWHEESPDSAVARLRDIVAQVRAAPGLTTSVAPYGEINAIEANYDLNCLLYRFEAARGNWDGSLAVAEYVIQTLGEKRTGASWLLTKAQCLMKLQRSAEAREFLFRIRDRPEIRTDVDSLLERIPRP